MSGGRRIVLLRETGGRYSIMASWPLYVAFLQEGSEGGEEALALVREGLAEKGPLPWATGRSGGGEIADGRVEVPRGDLRHFLAAVEGARMACEDALLAALYDGETGRRAEVPR